MRVFISFIFLNFILSCGEDPSKSNAQREGKKETYLPSIIVKQKPLIPKKIIKPKKENIKLQNIKPKIPTPDIKVSCPSKEHLEKGVCVKDIKDCQILNGQGKKVWKVNKWGNCNVFKCNFNFHIENNQCKANIKPCPLKNALGQSIWDGKKYQSCVFKSCLDGFGKNPNSLECLKFIDCTKNSKNSKKAKKTWNINTKEWGLCKADLCLEGYVLKSGNCLIKTRTCNILNGKGIESYDPINKLWGSCMAIGCSQGYHAYLKNQQCIKNKEFCKVMRYGQKIGEGQRYWQGSWNNGAWGSCEADLCKNYYKLIKKKCEPNYPKKEACKAHKYYNSAKLVLGLSDKEWCGDIEGRFKFINSGDDYIYDSLLKGFWSKKHNNLVTWAEAKKHCNSFKTKNWKMADIWQLNSLFSSLFDLNQGYISGLFADNLSGAFWSSTSCVFGSCSATTDGVWRLNFFSGVLSDSVAGIHFSHSVAKASEVRCFRPLSIAETPPK